MPALGGQGKWGNQVENVGYLGRWSRLFFSFRNADRSLQEGTVFVGHRGPFEAWDILPLLDERVALKFILPEEYLLG